MGLGFEIVLEQEVEGVDPKDVDGRTLARQRHALDAVAHEMDLPGLGEFVAFSQTEAETLAADMKFEDAVVGSGRWFDCGKGLEVVRAIHAYLGENPDEVDDAESVREELLAMQRILEAAEAAGSRFRLSVDY